MATAGQLLRQRSRLPPCDRGCSLRSHRNPPHEGVSREDLRVSLKPWPYTGCMPGYEKGSTPEGEMAHLREASARATTAIKAWPNATEAWKAANALTDLTRDLTGEAGEFRAF